MGSEIRYCEKTGEMIQPGLPYATNDEDVVWTLAAFNKTDPAERESLGMRIVRPGQEARPHSQIGLQAVPRTTPRHETPARDAARRKTEQPAPADAGQAGVAPPKPAEETQDDTDQAPKEQSVMTLLRNLALAGLGFAVIIFVGYKMFGVGDKGPDSDPEKSQQQPASAKAAAQAQRKRREAEVTRRKAAEQARAAEERKRREVEAARQKPVKPSAGDSAQNQKAPEAVDTAASQKALGAAAVTPSRSGLLREYWKKISGKEVKNLLNDPRYPDQPSGYSYISDFQAPRDWGDNYGARISGLLHPPVTGTYTFWIASNNCSELFLSRDHNPKNKVRIASCSQSSNSPEPNEWSKRKEQKSIPIVLKAGFSYYVEVLHKESEREDHVSVGWQLPDGTMERPIPAKRLTTAAPQQAPGVATEPTVVVSTTPLKNGLLREYWEKIKGSEVKNLLGNPRYPDQPSGHGYISDFQAPKNWGKDYGARISGLLHPPATGNYTFWIACDQGGELFLSTDYKPENKVRIASCSKEVKLNEWSKRKEQESKTIVLEAGFSYYIEVLHKEKKGDDHVSVGWQLPDGTMERPIPAKRLTPPDPRKATEAAAGPKPTWLPAGGKVGGALEFNGAGDYVLDPQGKKYLNGLKAITVSLWAKASAVGTDKGLFNGIKPDGEDEVLGLRYDKDGSDGGGKSLIKAALRVTSGNMTLESSSNVQTTAWQHIALTWKDGAKLSLYINGKLNKLAKVSSAGTGSTKGVTQLYIGKGSKDKAKEASSWDGLIDDVRIYSRALSAAEIKALSSIKTRRPRRTQQTIDLSSDLLTHWKFDETEGNQASDASGKGHHGRVIAVKVRTERTAATKALGIRWYQRALGPIPITGRYTKNFSGLTFSSETQTLFVVVDKPPMILELSLDGKLKRSIHLRGFADPEGIVHVSGETFYVVEEGRRKLCQIRLGKTTKSVNYSSCRRFIIDSKPAGNLGLEGVAYDPRGNRFFIVKEKSPLKIYLATVPEKGHGKAEVQEPWSLEETPDLKDVSGLHYDPASRTLLVLSHESRCVVEFTADGTELGRLRFDIPKAEGITMDHEGNLYICGEPNELYIFKK